MKSKEAILQASCVRWFRYQHPNGLLFAVPNGGSRHPKEAANLKRQGVVAGVSDLIMLHEGKAYFIELKVGTNKQTAYQLEFEERVRLDGFEYTVVRSVDEFREAVENIYRHNRITL